MANHEESILDPVAASKIPGAKKKKKKEKKKKIASAECEQVKILHTFYFFSKAPIFSEFFWKVLHTSSF